MNIRKGVCEDQYGEVRFEIESMYNTHGFRSF